MQTRREALKIIGAVGVTCAFPFSANELYGQHVHPSLQPEPAPAPRFFSAAQLALLARVTDLIIPPTDTPGAATAGVPAYIDLVVSEEPGLQDTFREGLSRLDAISQSRFSVSSFLQLTEPQQTEILTTLSEAPAGDDAAFFHALKNLTADGYYTSRIGLVQELGYNGDAYLASFPVFQIPEH
ncbi:MAG TPA: gluconate 2-dehydrogenase subunit 3 family protein [Acidobacteriaceae bacterium]|nr:gluconate 2-dehydrogenase subunit 3 family protein [Acidobacteriaceae bacterium]